MSQLLKRVIMKIPFYYSLRDWNEKRRQVKDLARWKRNGRAGPPPHIIKQCTLQTYARRFGLKILVETGTYYGDKNHVKTIGLENHDPFQYLCYE